MKNIIKRFLKDESGAALVEYAIIVALISIAAYGAIQTLGTNISEQFSTIGASVKGTTD